MKSTGTWGLAIAALLTLSACGGDAGEEKPALADSEQAAEVAKRETGDMTSEPLPPAARGEEPAPGSSAAEAVPAEPPTAFLQCRSCHAVEPGKNGVGPSLAGVAGRPAASVEGFRYSDALRNSGITWTREALDQFLAGPSRMVPGTRMVQMVRDEEQRKAVIDYLETLK